MNLLSNEVKTFIVVALACFDTPSKVAKDVKDEFGIEISRQAVQAYDPTKRAGAEVCEKWQAVFEATRAGFLASAETIGIAHRTVRLRMLERLIERADAQHNSALVAQLLVQAAKEVGDVYTNRHRIDARHHLSHEDALGALN